MMVTIKSLDGYEVDVTRLYIQALQKIISVEEYRRQLNVIVTTNKNV